VEKYTRDQIKQIVEQLAAISVAEKKVFRVKTEDKSHAIHIIIEAESMVSAMYFPLQNEVKEVSFEGEPIDNQFAWVDDWVEQEIDAYQAMMEGDSQEDIPSEEPSGFPRYDVLDQEDTLSLEALHDFGYDIEGHS
jgi:hypothetical protein